MSSDRSPSDRAFGARDSRVVPFRGSAPRRSAPGSRTAGERSDPLRRFERGQEPDDYRHRMTMNAVVLLIAVLLVASGLWLADSIAAMQKDQDCVLSGRRGCTKVEVPPTSRW
jgi:hypothetical protein